MHAADLLSDLMPETARFSLDDPDAAAKFAANLDRREVRLAFSEVCWHFRCTTPESRFRLQQFLKDLHERGIVLEVQPKLYCRPALQGGRSGEKAIRSVARKISKMATEAKAKVPKRAPKPRGVKDTGLRDRQAETLLAFARAEGPELKFFSFAAEGERHGMDRARVSYIISHLRARGMLSSNSYGTYRLTDRGAEAPVSDDAA